MARLRRWIKSRSENFCERANRFSFLFIDARLANVPDLCFEHWTNQRNLCKSICSVNSGGLLLVELHKFQMPSMLLHVRVCSNYLTNAKHASCRGSYKRLFYLLRSLSCSAPFKEVDFRLLNQYLNMKSGIQNIQLLLEFILIFNWKFQWKMRRLGCCYKSV